MAQRPIASHVCTFEGDDRPTPLCDECAAEYPKAKPIEGYSSASCKCGCHAWNDALDALVESGLAKRVDDEDEGSDE